MCKLTKYKDINGKIIKVGDTVSFWNDPSFKNKRLLGKVTKSNNPSYKGTVAEYSVTEIENNEEHVLYGLWYSHSIEII